MQRGKTISDNPVCAAAESKVQIEKNVVQDSVEEK